MTGKEILFIPTAASVKHRTFSRLPTFPVFAVKRERRTADTDGNMRMRNPKKKV